MDLSDYFDALTYVSYELVVSSTGLYASISNTTTMAGAGIPLCLSLPAWSGKAWDEHTGSPGCGSLSSWSIPSFHEPSWSTCSEWYFREETGWAPSLSASEDLLRRYRLGPYLGKKTELEYVGTREGLGRKVGSWETSWGEVYTIRDACALGTCWAALGSTKVGLFQYRLSSFLQLHSNVNKLKTHFFWRVGVGVEVGWVKKELPCLFTDQLENPSNFRNFST